MKKFIPRFLLAAAATGLSFLLLADESAYKMLGLAVLMAAVLTYGVLGWIRLPERQQQIRDGTAPGILGHRCIVCAGPLAEGQAYAGLVFLIQRRERDTTDVYAGEEIAACCQASCVRQLCTQLETILPSLRAWKAREIAAELSQLKG